MLVSQEKVNPIVLAGGDAGPVGLHIEDIVDSRAKFDDL